MKHAVSRRAALPALVLTGLAFGYTVGGHAPSEPAPTPASSDRPAGREAPVDPTDDLPIGLPVLHLLGDAQPSVLLPGGFSGVPYRDVPTVIDGIDYADPVRGGAVPLERVEGRQEAHLSRRFRLGDFAAHDGAAYARVSRDLVRALDRLAARAPGLYVVSGYRHRAHNAAVGGSPTSLHMTGHAADVAAPGVAPLALAAAALEAMGCRVGLGLGPTSVHVDVRGSLAAWTYPGAELDRAAFTAWVGTRCGLAPAADDAEAAPEPPASDSTARPPVRG